MPHLTEVLVHDMDSMLLRGVVRPLQQECWIRFVVARDAERSPFCDALTEDICLSVPARCIVKHWSESVGADTNGAWFRLCPDFVTSWRRVGGKDRSCDESGEEVEAPGVPLRRRLGE